MKKIFIYILITLVVFSAYAVRPALAQSETPPTGPTGQVRGAIMNRNRGQVVSESMEIMLHIMNKDFADMDMKHALSLPDGTFVFSDVPFDASLQYAEMAVYDGVTYFSDTTPGDMSSLQATIDVPVYESTSDLANIQVNQMHVLFDVAEDGLEIKEIYSFANTGERTVKDVYILGEDQYATLEFPLPEDADYIFFKPEDKDRFVKLSGGFADTYPILPATGASQIMVNYLVPYSGERTYTYTASLNIAMINLLVPDQADISLKGAGLVEPESMTLQNGSTVLVYSYSDLKAGQTIGVSIAGKATRTTSNEKSNNPFAIGAAFLGFAIIGAGVWWWRRPDEQDNETTDQPDAEMDFDQTINEIAHLDEAHEMGDIDEHEYRESREALRNKAKALLERDDKEKLFIHLGKIREIATPANEKA